MPPENAEAPHVRAGLSNLYAEFSYSAGRLLLATLLLTGLLLATLLLLTTLTGLRLAALLLLTTLLLTTLLAGLLVWILVHRSFLSNIGSPFRSLVFHGRSQSVAHAFVPSFTSRKMCRELAPTC